MSDEAVIVRNQGTIFLGGPPLVKAATGEEVTAEELGGGDLHARISGVADHLAEDDAHALPIVRDIVDTLGPRWRRRGSGARPRSPRTTRASSTASSRPTRAPPYDVHEVIARLVDGSRVPRVQARVRHDAGDRLRAAARAPGRHRRQQRRAVLASRRSRARTSSSCATSAAIPLVFLQNITGFMVGREYEAGGIAKDGAKMVTAVATTRVPKLTVIIGGSFGAGNYAMCGRAYSPRFLWMWPNAASR